MPTDTKDIVRRLEAIPRVKQAAVRVINVGRLAPQNGTTNTVYIGIMEGIRPNLLNQVTQTSDMILPAQIVDTYQEFERAMKESLRRGNLSDDFSHGHSMMGDKAVRAVQENFIPLADQNFESLTKVV